jgi:hypothetical protein
MVRRAAAWSSAEEGKHRDSRDAGAACGFDDVARAVNVDAPKSLPADLAVDAGEMGDGIAAREGFGHRVKVSDIPAGATREDDRFMPALAEQFRNMSADEAGAAGDDDAFAGHVENLPRLCSSA